MNSPLLLLISLVVAIQITMPIGTYLLFNGRTDEKSRLWLLSVSLMSAGISLAALRPFIPLFLSYQVTWLLVVGSMQLMTEALRHEFGLTTRWPLLGCLLIVLCIFVTALHFYGLTETLGIVTIACLMMFYACWAFILLQRLHQRYQSKSLRVLQFGMVLYGFPQLLRMYAYWITGDPNNMNVFHFGWVTNILIFSFVLAIMFVSLGYWGFTLEKSEFERNLAKAGEDKATQDAERYRQLVQERDQLLVINSRFSTISALSSFSAMLVHDITQPLQTLRLGLDRLRSNIGKAVPTSKIVESLDYLDRASDRAGKLVLSLRQLMQSGESNVSSVVIGPLFEQLDSILSSEALNQKVLIRFKNELSEGYRVKADPLMLQRIVINLVSNALNVFQKNPVNHPEISIQLDPLRLRDVDGLQMTVSDNGPGFPLALLERFGQPWSSENPDGLGMALLLSKQLIGLWGGEMNLANGIATLPGATIRIWLPFFDSREHG